MSSSKCLKHQHFQNSSKRDTSGNLAVAIAGTSAFLMAITQPTHDYAMTMLLPTSACSETKHTQSSQMVYVSVNTHVDTTFPGVEWKTLNAAQKQSRRDMDLLYGTPQALLRLRVGSGVKSVTHGSLFSLQVLSYSGNEKLVLRPPSLSWAAVMLILFEAADCAKAVAISLILPAVSLLSTQGVSDGASCVPCLGLLHKCDKACENWTESSEAARHCAIAHKCQSCSP